MTRAKMANLVRSRVYNFAQARNAVVGVSGNSPVFGTMVTGEYLKKLDGAKGRAVFDEMRRSDAQVKANLSAIALPLRGNSYPIEPASDDAKDVEIAETLEKRLTEGMSMPFDDVLRHICLMFPFGFSILEKVWEKNPDGLIMPKKLDPRLPMSIIRWEVNSADKSLIGPVQTDSDGKEYLLPIEKLLVFTTEREGDNWEGISILRAAYKPWYLKDSLEKINAIKHDRFGVGVPSFKTPGNITPETQQWKEGEAALERFYANEQGWIQFPDGWEFDIKGGGNASAGTDALPSIRYYDEKIAIAVLAMFMSLGATETGSRALGGTFVDVFNQSLQAYANYIADVFNRFLIPEWVDYNWDVDEYPKMRAGKIKPLDYQQLTQLVSAKIITPDLELENTVRESLNLPEKKEEDVVEEPTDGATEETDDEEPETDEPQADLAASDRNFADLADEEKIPALETITLRLNDAETNLQAEVLRMRDAQAQDIAQQLVGGRAIQNVRVILKKDMYDLMLATFTKQRKLGRQDVLDEAQKQRPGAKFADPTKRKPTTQRKLDIEVERISVNVEGAASKLKSTMAAWKLDLMQSGLQGEQLRVALMDRFNEMPTATWDVMASSAVNGGWGTGRFEGIEQLGDQVDYCYYSAILDGALCEECRTTRFSPGAEHHEPGDPEFVTPNPECLGGGRCRCMTIGVLKAEKEVSNFGGPGSGRYPKGSGGTKTKEKVSSAASNKVDKALVKKAAEKYGYTDNFADAGFIMDDGRMLNFQRSKGVYDANNHVEVAELVGNTEELADGTVVGMTEFMAETSGIRIEAQYDTDGLMSSALLHVTKDQPFTDAQKGTIKDLLKEAYDSARIELAVTTARGEHIGVQEFFNPSVSELSRAAEHISTFTPDEPFDEDFSDKSFGGPGSGRYPKGSGGALDAARTYNELPFTSEQKTALYNYIEGGYQNVNGLLRAGKQPEDGYQIDDAFASDECPVTESNITVYRGAAFDEALAEEITSVGGELNDAGFLSTSYRRDVAEGFTDDALDAGDGVVGIVYEVSVPAGTPYIKMTPTVTDDGNGAAELLFNRGTSLVTQSAELRGDVWYVKAQMVRD